MDLPKELDEALAQLEELAKTDAKKRRAADRLDVRAILIGLGDLILQHGPEEASTGLDRARELALRLGPEWEAACHSEVALACSEHINGVDARYLNHPKYDFKYTIRGRELLEARLIAARELKIPIEPSLIHGVDAADERLEPFLRE